MTNEESIEYWQTIAKSERAWAEANRRLAAERANEIGELQQINRELTRHVALLGGRVQALRLVVEMVEWACREIWDIGVCPWCREREPAHKSNCPRQLVLEETE